MDWTLESELFGRLCIAVLIGGLIGINRFLHRKPAGVRTHALVSLGAALAVLLVFRLPGADAQAYSRVAQGLITGVGFLGAGVILHHPQKYRIQGLTTAASIWVTAILGMACGAGMGGLALGVMLLALVVINFGGNLERLAERRLHRWREDDADLDHERRQQDRREEG
ncbi:MgtC/SapB family protein [Jeongeupia chitinilytica]|uniref:Protein MgtC n=1 Tax=Jeongeupia chitinilytica TaxID=1041641 RepID=A0ABQ3H1F3_9NEIS|nr:MgtC/SapB family protein [Jeongeupia chitinilytica]GHD62436.1 transport ATPase [Jeongeupia chitinilytica]